MELGRLKPKFATVWLGGCSGCHMSFLDLDEFLIELADLVDVVYSPIADVKEYPENVDIVLVEGAVNNEENLAILREIRARTKVLVAFGDCAVTGNVTAMRNPLGAPRPALDRAYIASADIAAQLPEEAGIVPPLLDQAMPVHAVVDVDVFLPGCPPSAARIREMLEQYLEKQSVELAGQQIKFG